MSQYPRILNKYLCTLWISAVGAAFIIIPIVTMITIGPFDWHIAQPEAWQGGLIAGALFISIYIFMNFKGMVRWIGTLGAGFIYARYNGVDLAILVIYLYIQGIFSVGWGLLFRGRTGVSHEKIYQSLLVGIVTWSAISWVLALMGFGSITAVHWAALLFFGLTLATLRTPSLIYVAGRSFNNLSAPSKLFFALILSMFFILFAKASVSTDYDSIWYGLRGERVLAGPHGLFSSLGLVAPVHYYPKLFEVLLLPLSGLGSMTLVLGLNIFCWSFALFISNAILRSLGTENDFRLAVVALIATLPALANISISAKGDTFAACLLLYAVLCLIKFKSTGKISQLLFGTAACILAPQARLSVLPYATLIILLYLFIYIQLITRRKDVPPYPLDWSNRAPGTITLMAAIVVVSLVSYRTLSLAGVPLILPSYANDLLSQIGFDRKFPVGGLPQGGRQSYIPLSGVISYIFNPSRYAHLTTYWTGNVWLFALLLSGLGLRPKTTVVRFARNLILTLGVIFFALVFFVKQTNADSYGADGNYFIFPVIALLCYSGFIFSGSIQKRPFLRRPLLFILFLFAISMASISFVTGNWGPGTRAIDGNFSRSFLNYSSHQAQALRSVGLSGVAEKLSSSSPDARTVGLAAMPMADWLPGRYESFDEIAWALPGLNDDVHRIVCFLQKDEIRYVVIPTSAHSGGAVPMNPLQLKNAISILSASGAAKRIYLDRFYELWELASASAESGCK